MVHNSVFFFLENIWGNRNPHVCTEKTNFLKYYSTIHFIKHTKFWRRYLNKLGQIKHFRACNQIDQTGNVCATTLRSIREIIVVVRKKWLLHILSIGVCVCVSPWLPSMQSACAMLYCYLWPVCLHHTLSHYHINGKIFWKKYTEQKVWVLFYIQL
jgi:hypothetical protein